MKLDASMVLRRHQKLGDGDIYIYIFILYIYIPRNSSGKYFCRRHNFKMKSPDVVNSALSH